MNVRVLQVKGHGNMGLDDDHHVGSDVDRWHCLCSKGRELDLWELSVALEAESIDMVRDEARRQHGRNWHRWLGFERWWRGGVGCGAALHVNGRGGKVSPAGGGDRE